MTSPSEDAALGILVQYAFDMNLADPGVTPPPDPRLLPKWAFRGYVVGQDALFRNGPLQLGSPTCYGFLVEATASPGTFVVVIRGTDGIIEWVEDGEFELIPHPVAGKVEAGFFGLYRTLQYAGLPAAQGIAAATVGGDVTVVGHSLGAALASYLTLDLAMIHGGPHTRGRFFASPRPGDDVFEALFDRSVADYLVYAYVLDAVPHVPLGLGYTPLRNVQTITPGNSQARIRLGLDCSHHIVDYCAELDYNLATWSKFPACDQDNVSCIKGSSGTTAQLARSS
jgi:triacylglycerol lipase